MTLHIVTFDFTLRDWCSFLFPIHKHRMQQISNLNAVAQASLSLYTYTQAHCSSPAVLKVDPMLPSFPAGEKTPALWRSRRSFTPLRNRLWLVAALT